MYSAVEPHPARLLLAGEAEPLTLIGELKPGVKNLCCAFIVLEKYPARSATNGHHHCTAKVSDESGCINITLWDEAGDYLQPGDICSLRGGSTSVYKGIMSLNAGKNAEILKTGRIIFPATLHPDMSVYNQEFENMFPSKSGQDEGSDAGVAKRGNSFNAGTPDQIKPETPTMDN